MREIIAIAQVTADGVMQAPGGPEEDPSHGFAHGGWAMAYGDDLLQRVLRETVADEFGMLLGRRTYDIFAGYWPQHGEHPIGKAFNRATKYVVTHRADRLAWENSQPISGDVVGELRRLKASAGPALQVWGSGALLQTLIAAGLVDEFRLWIAPLVLGRGKRLFEPAVPPTRLTRVESLRTSAGVLLNTYRPQRGESG